MSNARGSSLWTAKQVVFFWVLSAAVVDVFEITKSNGWNGECTDAWDGKTFTFRPLARSTNLTIKKKNKFFTSCVLINCCKFLEGQQSFRKLRGLKNIAKTISFKLDSNLLYGGHLRLFLKNFTLTPIAKIGSLCPFFKQSAHFSFQSKNRYLNHTKKIVNIWT